MPEHEVFTIEHEATFELVRERSRFVAVSFRVRSLEEGKQKLAEAMERFPGATHYVYALRAGNLGEYEFASDAGEPKGSAGRPVLGALRRLKVTNAMVVVARYFGGKKLGIRGLIDAYGDAAAGVLEASRIRPFVAEVHFTVTPKAEAFELFAFRLLRLLRTRAGVNLEKEKGRITFSIPRNREEDILAFLEGERLQGTIRTFTKEG